MAWFSFAWLILWHDSTILVSRAAETIESTCYLAPEKPSSQKGGKSENGWKKSANSSFLRP